MHAARTETSHECKQKPLEPEFKVVGPEVLKVGSKSRQGHVQDCGSYSRIGEEGDVPLVMERMKF